ncbi:hypothetical protein G5I_11826 [Acromyrmex echinatior]|uniref:Uncharacterized protein n=1 Tax=Acromyrmex echinatior TaxID=103372 RepID=F4X0P4_ACREC|nr:hypothetical protein G5I_11826 [Acromyrmex echinatior]
MHQHNAYGYHIGTYPQCPSPPKDDLSPLGDKSGSLVDELGGGGGGACNCSSSTGGFRERSTSRYRKERSSRLASDSRKRRQVLSTL